MRHVLSYSLLGLGLMVISCDTGSTVDSNCPSGQESCGTNCVPAGYCQGSGGGSAQGNGGTTQTAVDPGPFTSAECTDSATASGVIANQYGGTTIAADGGKQYYLAANWWGKYDAQTIKYQGLSFTVGNPNAVTSDGNDPIGYPTLYIGTYTGHANAGSNLPKQVSALTSVPTVFSTNAADLGRDQYNAAYDVWFTPTGATLGSSEYAPPPGGAYLMVWLFKPTSRQPRGGVRRDNHSVAGVPDVAWNVWVDSTDPPCISYVATKPLNGLAFDLNDFIQDSVTNNFGITSSMYLSVVFAGFEIWGRGDGLQVKNFCAKVN